VTEREAIFIGLTSDCSCTVVLSVLTSKDAEAAATNPENEAAKLKAVGKPDLAAIERSL
jgi:hypothetical protein